MCYERLVVTPKYVFEDALLSSSLRLHDDGRNTRIILMRFPSRIFRETGQLCSSVAFLIWARKAGASDMKLEIEHLFLQNVVGNPLVDIENSADLSQTSILLKFVSGYTKEGKKLEIA